MQITLNQDEITQAVETYVRSQITVAANQSINIDFTNGRSPNGLTATLDIRSGAVASKPAVTRSVAQEAPVADTQPDSAPPAEPENDATDTDEGTTSADVKEETPAPKASPFAKKSTASEDTPEEAPAKPKSVFSKAS